MGVLGQVRASVRALLAASALVTLVSGRALAQGATITGRVAAQGSGEVLPESRVIVVGTQLFTSTGADGRYTLRNVPAGTYDLRVLRVGYTEQKKPITVTAGQSLTVDFDMAAAIIRLAEVVTTATGEQRRVELGNSVTSVNVTERTATAPVTDVASLLVAQSPGVQVMPSNATGVGARVRIRGVNSISLVNDPIYVIDGVRMRSDNGSISGNIFTGGAAQSRANDINPSEIESIEIVKGPSAATLYGTDASNGVIVITTKRGRAGQTRYNVFAEQGLIQDRNTWPTAYTLWGHAPAGQTRNCTNTSLTQVSSGLCVADSLSKFNLFDNARTTPLGTGNRQVGGLQVSGGLQQLRFFVAGQYENEEGILKIPDFDRQRLDTLNIRIRDEWATPNALKRGTFRANLDAALSPKLDAQFSSGYITLANRLPQNDNNAYGLLSNAFGGPGYERGRISTIGYDLHGYRASTPAESFQMEVNQYINRYMGASNINYRPMSWLAVRADAGVDFIGRIDQELCRRGTCADVGTVRQGFVQDDRTNFRTITANGIATASFTPFPSVQSRTSVGTQWVNNTFDRNGAGASNLTPGATTLNGGATKSADASYERNKTFGVFIEEQLSLRDRLFLTAAVRSDQNSAFGTNFQRVYYPKFSASYVLSDEAWFPKSSLLTQFRLRSAYGASGVQPGANDALRYYSPTTSSVAALDQPGVTFTSLGNDVLKPERATEFEGGFDSRWLSDRVSLELTYYRKLTKDALIGAVVPPSLGTGNSSQRANLGSVRNSGLEVLLNALVVDNRHVTWNASINGSTNDNELVTLGKDAQGRPLAPQVGTTTRNQPGYPLFGYWQRKIRSYADANKDGILTLSEISVDDSSTFVGYSVPRYEAVLSNSLEFFKKQLRVTALFDYKGGHTLLNGTERIRCGSRNNCFGAYDKTAPLWQQARAVAVREHASRTQAGYMEKADFVRFRELSANWLIPKAWTQRAWGAKDVSLNFAARNLKLWTDYSGLDPESNSDVGSTATLPSDFQAMPVPSYFILRLNVAF
ncbi:MAG: SusC/RagA family TonB-linked outer membrane protein [Gemmatimonadaceae bacterium]|nr:SusC/RagA family TonB-linked outer membrane protein [Gemmatimonadaceae bacterium]